jgi:hypothetical protein
MAQQAAKDEKPLQGIAMALVRAIGRIGLTALALNCINWNQYFSDARRGTPAAGARESARNGGGRTLHGPLYSVRYRSGLAILRSRRGVPLRAAPAIAGLNRLWAVKRRKAEADGRVAKSGLNLGSRALKAAQRGKWAHGLHLAADLASLQGKLRHPPRKLGIHSPDFMLAATGAAKPPGVSCPSPSGLA